MASPLTDSNVPVVDHVNLLCTEDACACLSDNDDREDENTNCKNEEDGCGDETMFVHEESTLPELQQMLSILAERERHYLPEPDFVQNLQAGIVIDAVHRKRAVSWLLKMHQIFMFSAYTASLAVNYLDRFLSLHQLPSGRAWPLQLLSVACLSLAAKMEEIEVPPLLELQVGSDLLFEPCTVQRMELLVLTTLGWKMSSVTSISYTSHFINRLELPTSTKRALISKANELILSSIQEIRFLRFRPSCLAAAATLCAFQEDLPRQLAEQRKSLLCLMPQQLLGELASCLTLMSELFGTHCGTGSTYKDGDICESSIPQSPVAVLDASFSSNSISNITTSNNNSHSCCPPISSPSPPKKRRTDDPSH